MSDPAVPPGTDPLSQPSTPSVVVAKVKQLAAQLHTPGNAFLLPDNTVRYFIVVVVVAGYLWMQWHSPKDGAVPQELVGIAGIVAGYALAGKGSATMKALVSIVFVLAEVAFLMKFQWAPGTITGQVSLIVGTYFGAAETKQLTK